MIEIFGQSAVNTAVKAGLDKFYSVFTRRVAASIGGHSPRTYTTTRGFIIRKADIWNAGNNLAHLGYYFQFNPEKVADTKSTEYSTVPYPGLNYNDYAWGHGGERLISFQLFLDDTPGSHTSVFRPSSYDSFEARYPNPEGAPDPSALPQQSWKDQFVENAKSVLGVYPSYPSWADDDSQWSQTGAYSRTRMSSRGVMDVVDKITQFLYPDYGNSERPLFASGGVIDDAQFRPPSTAVLILGPRYFEGIVKAAPVEYTLFDADLTPIRATINVEFAAYEFADVHSIYESKFKQI